MQSLIFGHSFGQSLTLKSKYPRMSLKDIINSELEKAMKNYNSLKNKLIPVFDAIGDNDFVSIDDEMLKKIQKADHPSEAMILQFLGWANQINLMHYYLVEGGDTHFSSLIKKDYAELYDMEKIKKDIDIIINQLDNLKKNKIEIEEEIKFCKQALINNLNSLPSREEKDNYIRKTRSLIKETKKTSTSIISFLDKIHLDFPETKEDIVYLMQSRTDEEIKVQDQDIGSAKKKKNEKTQKKQLFFFNQWDFILVNKKIHKCIYQYM